MSKEYSRCWPSTQAQNPTPRYSAVLVPATGTPTARAAAASPPTAKIQFPKLVRSSTQLPTTSRPSHHQTVALTVSPPTVISEANSQRQEAKPSMSEIGFVVTVPVTSLVTPRFAPVSIRKVPSVTMKLGSPVRPSIQPLKPLTASATSSETRVPTQVTAVSW